MSEPIQTAPKRAGRKSSVPVEPKKLKKTAGISTANPFYPFIPSILSALVLPVLLEIMGKNPEITRKRLLYRAYISRVDHKPSYPTFLEWLKFLKITASTQLQVPGMENEVISQKEAFDNIRPMAPMVRPVSRPRELSIEEKDQDSFDNTRAPIGPSDADLELRGLFKA